MKSMLYSFPFISLLSSWFFITSLAQAQSNLEVLSSSQPFEQCGISQIRWKGSVGISRVAVIDAKTYEPLYIFLPQAPETFSLTFNPINITAGTEVRVVVTDSTQSTSVSNPLQVQDSTSAECLSSSQGNGPNFPSILPTVNSITSELGPSQIASILNLDSKSSSASHTDTSPSTMTSNATSSATSSTSNISSTSGTHSVPASGTGKPGDSNASVQNSAFFSTSFLACIPLIVSLSVVFSHFIL